MLGFEIREKFPRWPDPPLLHVIETLTDAFLGTRARGNIEEPLIRFGILHYGRSLSFHHRALGLY